MHNDARMLISTAVTLCRSAHCHEPIAVEYLSQLPGYLLLHGPEERGQDKVTIEVLQPDRFTEEEVRVKVLGDLGDALRVIHGRPRPPDNG